VAPVAKRASHRTQIALAVGHRPSIQTSDAGT
jgi:hypothetical protein